MSAKVKAVQRVTELQPRNDELLLILLRLQPPSPGNPYDSSSPGKPVPFGPLLWPVGTPRNVEKEWLLKRIEEVRFFDAMQKGLESIPEDELLRKIQDPVPVLRWLAIQAAARKRLSCEDQLIGRLNDPVPALREAARGALIRLSRGSDFGPFRSGGPTPVAYAREVNDAMANWKQWLKAERAGSTPELDQ